MSEHHKHEPCMKDLRLNDPVSITLPVHVWLGFMAAYGNTEWTDANANNVLTEVQEALFDPRYIKEFYAEQQRRHNQHHQVIARLMPGMVPPPDDVPPDISGLTDTP